MTVNAHSVQIEGIWIVPSKIICIGRNYAAHAAELGNDTPEEMIVFMKPNSAITTGLTAGHNEEIHYEGEICFMIQNGSFAAVAFGLDLTKRKMQEQLKAKGLPWERCKAFDGSALFSPFVKIKEETPDLSLKLTINDSIVQQDGVRSMIFKPDAMIKELKTFLTLCDGDIVMTGTPAGVGAVKPGDIFKGAIHLGGKTITAAEWTAVC